MKKSLQSGLTYSHTIVVPDSKLVPSLYPEAEEFSVMLKVFATGYLVGLLECASRHLPHTLIGQHNNAL
jgi:fluoroacetyl-CoA thioesterase